MVADFFQSIRLLTILPAPQLQPRAASGALFFFPIVGAILGLILVGVNFFLQSVSPFIAAALAVAFWVFLTRGLHIDGVADTADAMFSMGDRDRRLAIMRDPHAGPMGIAAIVLVLQLKVSSLASLDGSARYLALLLAPLYARWIAVLACFFFRYARREGGLGEAYIGRARFLHVGATSAVTIGLSLLLDFSQTLLLVPISLILGLGIGFLADRSLNGITGDVLGSIIEWTEAAVLIGMAVPAHG